MKCTLKNLLDPHPDQIGETVTDFLRYLGGPSIIFLTGNDISRTRAFVTLLHGNEPSGVKALFRWLKSGRRPQVNIVCIIASVEAAMFGPAFSHRVIDPMRDLNRCFNGPFDDEQGELARDIVSTLQRYQPESVIDMHNTSGSGPSFAVATFSDQKHEALTTLFTQRLIITHLKLGALMEISEHLCPTVTIECGGRLDNEADEIGWDGLSNYFSSENVFAVRSADWGLELLHNPVRLELNENCSLCYSDQASSGYNLTLPPTVEHLNFGVTRKNTLLGWVNNGVVPELSNIFSCRNSVDESVLNELIYIVGNEILVRQDLKLFMITCDPLIAKMDCLLYAVKSDGSELSL